MARSWVGRGCCSWFARGCCSWLGVERVGIGRRLGAGGMIGAVDRMLRLMEAGMIGVGFGDRRPAWRIDWLVGRGKMGFVDYSRFAGNCTGCSREHEYLVAACCSRAEAAAHMAVRRTGWNRPG